MSAQWRYRGREISTDDVAFIRQLIATHTGASRRALSAKLCEAWQWRQANGSPRDMVCRGLLLMLHRAGEIELPPVRYAPPNPLAQRTRPPALSIDTTPIHSPLHTLQPVAFQQERPIACLAWSSAPRHLASRDRYIGWSGEARRRNIGFIAYNTRFLILPWVRVPHLASHILSRIAQRLSQDWERVYRHPIYFLETFVDPERFRGTCYRAANWVL